MATAMGFSVGSYPPENDYFVEYTGLTDGAGNPLTNLNSSGTVTMTDNNGHGSAIVAAVTWPYIGSGHYKYTVPAALMVKGGVMLIEVRLYDVSGATLHAWGGQSLTAQR